MNDESCLSCSCTFTTGCREEQQRRENPPVLRRYIPPMKLCAPPVQLRKRDPDAAREYARDLYRKRIEERGGTVRARK